jgi:hypothetical protein
LNNWPGIAVNQNVPGRKAEGVRRGAEARIQEFKSQEFHVEFHVEFHEHENFM